MNTKTAPKIVVADKMSTSAMERLRTAGQVVELSRRDEQSIIAAVADADALVVRTYSIVTRRVIEAGPRLKVIARAGVGLDNVDLDAARERGIPVVYTPAASTHAVSDLAIGMILSLQREIHRFDREVRTGDFNAMRARKPVCPELRHQTIGIIGMGRIGSQVARRMVMGFGARVIYHDIREVGPFAFPATPVSRDQVLASSDVVSLHVPMTALTRGMINRDSLARMKPTSYLINTCRGPVLVAQDVADALRSGQIAGAAVDVFDPEPPPPDHPLFAAPNCLLTPHVASRSPEGLAAMNDVVDDVIAVLQGRSPQWQAAAES